VPALYQIETGLIDGKVKTLTSAFSKSRDIMAEDAFSEEKADEKTSRSELLKKLSEKLDGTFPEETLEVLLRYDFSPMLEARLLSLLNSVMRDGIVEDRGELSKEYFSGIMVSDGTMASERLSQDIWQKRDLAAAKEFLEAVAVFKGTSRFVRAGTVDANSIS